MIENVRSADGTAIAYERTGSGPPLVLVGGAFNDRTGRASGTPLAALLAPRFTVHSYDRRGRGDSTDTPPYAVAREVEDLAALLAASGPAIVYGMSSGAVLALEAAAAQLPITQLWLYEPPIGNRNAPPDLAARLASASRGDAVELFLTVVGTPAAVIARMRQAPVWAALERLAHTLAYDAAITALPVLDDAKRVAVPARVLSGAASPPWLQDAARAVAAALPRGSFTLLAGQTHDVDPAVLAAAL